MKCMEQAMEPLEGARAANSGTDNHESGDPGMDASLGRVCPWYLLHTFDNGLRGLVHNPRTILGVYVRPAMSVADLGCGFGFFSLALARMVGEQGTVYAADVQEQALTRLRGRAAEAGLASIIETRLCKRDSLDVPGPLDFTLCFWMLHEALDRTAFLAQVHGLLAPGGRCLVAEPRMHVRAAIVEREKCEARAVGFQVEEAPPVAMSRAFVLHKAGD